MKLFKRKITDNELLAAYYIGFKLPDDVITGLPDNLKQLYINHRFKALSENEVFNDLEFMLCNNEQKLLILDRLIKLNLYISEVIFNWAPDDMKLLSCLTCLTDTFTIINRNPRRLSKYQFNWAPGNIKLRDCKFNLDYGYKLTDYQFEWCNDDMKQHSCNAPNTRVKCSNYRYLEKIFNSKTTLSKYSLPENHHYIKII